MPSSDVESQLGEFRYVTYAEVEKLEELHPLVHRFISKKKHQRLVECPDISGDFPWFFYIADGERIYSHLSAIPDVLTAEGNRYPWAWTGDLVTDPVYRGRGLAKRVVEETIKVLHQNNYIPAGGFATEVTIHIYKKLGFALPGFVSRYLFLKTIRPLLEYHVRYRLFRIVADVLYRGLILLFRPLQIILSKPLKNKVSLKKIDVKEDAPSRADMPKLRYPVRYHFNDSLPKLLWKIDWTRHDTTLYFLINEATKEPWCYLVIREKQVSEPILDKYGNFKLMTLMDFGFFTDDQNVYQALVNKVFHIFWKSEAEVLEIISSSALLNACAKHLGMRKVGKGVPFMFTAPSKLDLGSRCGDLAEWHLTHYSGEGFLMR
jgi:GNAT superfamily N-acetyltransferase